jgi:hypothetical protein
MAKVAKRLAGPAALTTSAATKYTAPTGGKAIIRELRVSNPSAAPVDLTVSIGADAVGTRIIDGYPIPADTTMPFFGYWVIESAEVVQMKASTTDLVYALFGDELTAG